MSTRVPQYGHAIAPGSPFTGAPQFPQLTSPMTRPYQAWHTRCSIACMNAIRRLRALGQSAWLDYVDHELVTSGELRRLIQQDGITGLTSNPTIFEKAIAGSRDYDDLIEEASP